MYNVQLIICEKREICIQKNRNNFIEDSISQFSITVKSKAGFVVLVILSK